MTNKTQRNFDPLSWNNCRLYGLWFPDENFRMTMFLDFAIRNPISDPEFGKWELAPSELTFQNVSEFSCDVSPGMNMQIDIVHIERTYVGKTPNGELDLWKFEIELAPRGNISLKSTGFEQKKVGNPRISERYDLERSDIL